MTTTTAISTPVPNARFPVDLQAHTTCSDGAMGPEELIALAAQVGIRALAITDHDSVLGVDRALAAGKKYGVEVVPAVELSLRNEPERDFVDLDMLGYWIDPHHPMLEETLQHVQEGRIAQKKMQVQRLRELGYQVSWEEVQARAKGVPGRPHIAQVLMSRYPEEFPTLDSVFTTLLRNNGPLYVQRPFALQLEEAAALIHEAGGLPVLAHPGLYTDVRDLEGMIARAAYLGVRGLEVWYPYNKTRVCRSCPSKDLSRFIARFARLAERLNLLKTGGSDFHGSHKPIYLGEQGLTWEQYTYLKEQARKLYGVRVR